MIYTIKRQAFVKYPHYYDVIGDKVRLAYVRCPKCSAYLSIYKGEIDEDGLTKTINKCTCGFRGRLQLIEWTTQ